jgi:hypothetical protein
VLYIFMTRTLNILNIKWAGGRVRENIWCNSFGQNASDHVYTHIIIILSPGDHNIILFQAAIATTRAFNWYALCIRVAAACVVYDVYCRCTQYKRAKKTNFFWTVKKLYNMIESVYACYMKTIGKIWSWCFGWI